MFPPSLPQLFRPFLPSIPLVIVTLFFAVLSLARKNNSSKKTRLPPSPFKLPVIGNLHQLGSLPHRSLHALAQRHGPLMLLQLGQVPALVVSSADTAREIMKTQDHIFANRPSLKVPERLLYGGRDVAFAPNGEHWRQARKICVHHLLSTKMVQSYQQIREEEVALMVDNVARSCSSSSAGSAVNVSEILNSLTKRIISRIALGNSSGEEKAWMDTIHLLITECSMMMGAFHVGDYFPRLAWVSSLTGLDARVDRAFEKFDKIIEEIIRSHIERPKANERGVDDFVDVLLDLEKNFDMGFGKESIKAMVEDMFGAGTESTYIVMEWAMTELLRNPEAMKKLKDEVRGIMGSNPVIKEEDLEKMNYLKAAIKEAMRLHPPAPFLVPRESMDDTEIQQYRIPRKTRIWVNAWAIGRDPSTWEDPEEFRPERFLGSSIDFKGHDFQFIPFGAGRRVCPGIGYTVPVVELALARLMHGFDWKLPDGMAEEEMDMEEAFGLAMRKKNNLHLVATPCFH